jgi:RNA:NAD 2'-phosphotransferase (TPT1/KptA family)
MKFYHGTSRLFVNRILLEGLRPWGETGRHNWDSPDGFGAYVPRRDAVYLAVRKRAEDYARDVAEVNSDEEGVLLEVEVDIGRLIADEDSGERDWESSLNKTGTCAHLGRIEPSRIRIVESLRV